MNILTLNCDQFTLFSAMSGEIVSIWEKSGNAENVTKQKAEFPFEFTSIEGCNLIPNASWNHMLYMHNISHVESKGCIISIFQSLAKTTKLLRDQQ